MENRNSLGVFYDNLEVGKLAQTEDYKIAFQYSHEWIKNGFSISPISLPLSDKVFIPKRYDPFDGLFGVFSDSLPDGWGRLLVDRFLTKNGINQETVNPLTRLAIVGSVGMGALEYKPSEIFQWEMESKSIDELAIDCKRIFETRSNINIDDIFKRGGSSGGARPKIFYKIDNEEWIVKFKNSQDPYNIGIQEFEYNECAKYCGIDVAPYRLLNSNNGDGYFATKRFDIENNKRIHMVSVSGLLESSHRIPILDYHTLMELTLYLTKNYEEVEALYRLMCFNVFSHNRDDHSKNFSFIYKKGEWKLSPAYDLTYSYSLNGEHATTINGNGVNPDINDILEVAKNAKIPIRKAKTIALDIKEIVHDQLKEYLFKK